MPDTPLKSLIAIHLLAARVASGSLLSRTRVLRAPAQPVLRILDNIAFASPTMSARREMNGKI
jgi:hypothetical protein